MRKLFLAMVASGMLTVSSHSSLANTLEQMQIEFLNDNTNVVKFDFSEETVKPQVLDSKDNEIHLLFSGLTSEMKEDFFNIQESGIKNVSIEEDGNDLHVYINLTAKHKYDFNYTKETMIMELTQNSISYEEIESAWKYNNEFKISDVLFNRHSNEHADIIIKHNDTKADFDVVEFDGGVQFTFEESSIPTKLFEKKDVSEFSTPIQSYLTKIEDGKAVLKVFYNPNYKASFVTTEIGNQFVVIVKGEDYKQNISNLRNKNNSSSKDTLIRESSFDGDLISFNFQDVPIKSALFVIAKKMNLNLVMGDNINGRITLLLDNVPHDQALDIILRTKGLGKYIEGNVMLVAPLEEIVQRQEFELSSKKKIVEISPLKSDTVQIKYAKSEAVYTLLDKVKSNRGNIIFDERTNKMFLEDTPQKLFEMKNLIEEIDIPVRQVAVEARIVYAQKSASKEMGIKWSAGLDSDDFTGVGNTSLGLGDGSSIDGNGIDLTLGFMSANVDATLTALEDDGDIEIVARPLVLAANKQKSKIASGKEYPYAEISDSGDVTTSFKEIVLSLDVTPQITPNDKLILDLEIVQDAIAELTDAGPALDTTEISTQVIVDNKETLVLGGVFKDTVIDEDSRVPILGDIPLLGKAFSYSTDSTEQVELLIFITPTILNGEDIIRR